MTTRLYDPKQSHLVVGARLITGFADGTGIKVSRNSASLTLHTGMDGEHAVTRSQDRSGTIELTLMAASAANEYLSAKMLEHETLGTGFVPVALKDLLGTTHCNGADAFIEKPADVERAKEHGEATWKIVVPDLMMHVGSLIGV